MPPKKSAGVEGNELLAGFTDKETKLIAAAFLSTTGPDKVDYGRMATLTGNTVGSLKKMWPPVKKKAMENNPSFAKFMGYSTGSTPPASEASESATAPKSEKRKAADEVLNEVAKSEPEDSDSKKKAPKKPAAKCRGRAPPKKRAKKEETDDEEHASDGDEDDSEAEEAV